MTGATRPYKVVVPVNTRAGAITAGSSSKASYTRSVVLPVLAGFEGGQNKKVGQTATVYTWVKPGVLNTAKFDNVSVV